jgi:hypothetical protein
MFGQVGVAQALGKTKIGQVTVFILIQQNIGRFYIAMDNTGSMGAVQGGANLLHQSKGCIKGKWSTVKLKL